VNRHLTFLVLFVQHDLEALQSELAAQRQELNVEMEQLTKLGHSLQEASRNVVLKQEEVNLLFA